MIADWTGLHSVLLPLLNADCSKYVTQGNQLKMFPKCLLINFKTRRLDSSALLKEKITEISIFLFMFGDANCWYFNIISCRKIEKQIESVIIKVTNSHKNYYFTWKWLQIGYFDICMKLILLSAQKDYATLEKEEKEKESQFFSALFRTDLIQVIWPKVKFLITIGLFEWQVRFWHRETEKQICWSL